MGKPRDGDRRHRRRRVAGELVKDSRLRRKISCLYHRHLGRRRLPDRQKLIARVEATLKVGQLAAGKLANAPSASADDLAALQVAHLFTLGKVPASYEGTMRVKHINPRALYDGAPVGLSHALVDLESGLVFISGQVDWNLEHQVSSDSVAGQLASALEKLKLVLHESGASVDTLLQIRLFVRGEFEEHMASMVPILKGFLGSSRTAITAVGVASLASKATLVEVEAIARIK